MRHMVAFLLVFALYACARAEAPGKAIEPFWLRVLEDHDLIPTELVVIREDGKRETGMVRRGDDTRGDPFLGGDLKGFVFAQSYGFWLELEARQPHAVEANVLWPAARYIDESGKAHEVYAQPRGVLPDDPASLRPPPPERLPPGGNLRPTVVPIFKQYLVKTGRGEATPYSEPLLPATLRGKSEAQTKMYLDDLAERRVPVKLLLPVEMKGLRSDYIFTFIVQRESNPGD
jgi:hypothetical protein